MFKKIILIVLVLWVFGGLGYMGVKIIYRLQPTISWIIPGMWCFMLLIPIVLLVYGLWRDE